MQEADSKVAIKSNSIYMQLTGSKVPRQRARGNTVALADEAAEAAAAAAAAVGVGGEEQEEGEGTYPAYQEAPTCAVCSVMFTLSKRRHHCRRCGLSVCDKHSNHKVLLSGLGRKKQRICDACMFFIQYHPQGAAAPLPAADDTTTSHAAEN